MIKHEEKCDCFICKQDLYNRTTNLTMMEVPLAALMIALKIFMDCLEQSLKEDIPHEVVYFVTGLANSFLGALTNSKVYFPDDMLDKWLATMKAAEAKYPSMEAKQTDVSPDNSLSVFSEN